MVKKIVLSFFITLFFFNTIAVNAQGAIENSIKQAEKTVDGLKNIEKIPIAEDVGWAVSTIKSSVVAYQTIKMQIIDFVNYFRKAIQFINEFLERIKDYVNDKIGYVSKKYEINPFLTQNI